MLSRGMSRRGLPLATLLLLTGCASKQIIATECPRFTPSAEALNPMAASPWMETASRLTKGNGASAADLLNLLEQGERLEATLALCQSELRQCAALR